jgi:hypothetical protein
MRNLDHLPEDHPRRRMMEKPDPAYEAEIARTKAIDAARAEADRIAREALGATPLWEMLAWPAKEEAARRYLAGEATEADMLLLRAETAQTGETEADLAALVVRRADAFRQISGHLTGMRRAAEG